MQRLSDFDPELMELFANISKLNTRASKGDPIARASMEQIKDQMKKAMEVCGDLKAV